MAAIRELKPSYRQDRRIRRAQTAPQPEDVELVLPPVEDTTLHYGGSPLMQPEIVLDPESLTVVAGSDLNWKTEDWLAIGLATENTEGANNDVVQEGSGGNPVGSPLDGSGGVHQPPVGGEVVYTEVGPSRAALYFDLSGIPSDAIITEATLELVPYDSDPGDLYGEGTVENLWPTEGVNLEILNLPQDATPDATWNTKNGESLLVPFDVGAGQVTVPDPGQRWWRTVGGVLPPNPIGVGQNTRRFDLPEPADLFENQINPGNFNVTGSNTIDGDPGDPEEYYGHIGYGISGGGYAVNIDPDNPSTGNTTFNVSKAAWDNQQSGTAVNDFSVSVINEVLWANATGNRQCNFLVRASHWEENTTAQFPNDQLTFPDNSSIDPVSLTTAHISDTAGGASITQAEQSDTLHVVDDASGDPLTVEYVWQIEVPYVELDPPSFLMFGAPGEIKEGDTIALSSFQISRNGAVVVNPNDKITLEYLLGGSTVATFGPWDSGSASPDTSFIIPQASEGDTLRARMTVTNSVDPDGAADTQTTEQDLGAIAPDDAGTVSVTIDGNPTTVAERSDITARATSTDVANPRYRFELRHPTSSDVFAVRDFDVSDTATFEVPQVGSAGGEFRIRVVMNNSAGEQVDTDLTSAINISDVPDVGEANQAKFDYVAPRFDLDPFARADTFISKSSTLGANFTDSRTQFPNETAGPDLQDFNVASISFHDLMDPDPAAVGAYAKLQFVGSGVAADDRATLWAEHFHGIQLTIRNSSGAVVSTHTFSAEGFLIPDYRINDGDQDGNSDGVVLWMNTGLDQSPNIPDPAEMQTIRQNIFNNSTQIDNGVDTVFGESHFFFDIDYIRIPADPGGGDDNGEVIDVVFGDGSEGSGTANAANSGSLMFASGTSNINADSIMMVRILNFDGQFNPENISYASGVFIGDPPVETTSAANHKFLTPEMVEVFDKNSHPDLLGSARHASPPPTSSSRTFDVLSAPDFAAEDGNQSFTSLSVTLDLDGDGVDESYDFPEIYVLYAVQHDTSTFNLNLPDITCSFYNLNSSIGSDQTLVYEVIRDGAVVGRLKATPNASAVGKNHFGYDAGGNYSNWFLPDRWAVGDTIVTMVVPDSVAATVSDIDVPAP